MIGARFESGDQPALVLTGTGAVPERVELRGPRAATSAVPASREDSWSAVVPLHAARWGGPDLPLPSGDYRLRVVMVGGRIEPVDAALPAAPLGPLRAGLSEGTVRIAPPLAPEYSDREGQEALERRYANGRGPLENAVFFESFYGRMTACNPLAIDRELARVAPDVIRYWSVVDLSVAVPDGAVAVVEGTPQWWQARGSARLLVVNDWLRRRFARRPGQIVLQTWHGTPLKRLALHRPGFDPRRAAAVIRESRRWNVLLAQNPYSARVLRKAYAFLRRPIWIEGYPRNDVLRTGDAAVVRERLGIAAAERVLLYAPTWRDDRDEIVDFLDVAALAERTGSVVLVRGHSRTIAAGRDARGPRVIDVTTYPDVSELLLAADALVTDYSSVMFDFTVTGKPIHFFVPDLDHYRERLRGFYVDFAAHAPGPVAVTQEELERGIDDAGTAARYADRYRAWRERFNARDDGHAAQRVVARILDQGFVAR